MTLQNALVHIDKKRKPEINLTGLAIFIMAEVNMPHSSIHKPLTDCRKQYKQRQYTIGEAALCKPGASRPHKQ